MNNRTLDRILHLSRELHHCCDSNNYRHLSFLVKRNNIVSIGFNSQGQTKRVRKLNLYNGYADGSVMGTHAETSAIILNYKRDISDLKNCTLVNTRISKTGAFGMSCPCTQCQTLISWCGIKKVIYTNKQGQWEDFKF